MRSLILTFPNTSAALLAEKALAGRRPAAGLIPVPSGISSDCGFCLSIPVSGEAPAPGLVAALPEGLGFEGAWLETAVSEAGSRRKEKRYERIVQDRRREGPALPAAGRPRQEGP